MNAATPRRPRGGFDRGLLAPMLLGAVLNPVNSSIIAVSLIPIGRAFGAPPSDTAWLVAALYLATAVGQPVAGRLIDLHGPRRAYLVATALTGDVHVLGGNLPLIATYTRAVLTYVVSYSVLYGYTQWLQEGRGLSPTHAGLLQLPMFVTGIAPYATSAGPPQGIDRQVL